MLADLDKDKEEEEIKAEGMIFHRAHIRRAGLNPFVDLTYLMRTALVMRQVAPLLVHNVTTKPVIYGTIAARVTNIGAIVNAISGLGYSFTDATDSRRLLAAILRRAYRFTLCDPRVRVIFQNSADMDLFVESALVTRQQVALIKGSGVDLQQFQPTSEPNGIVTVVLPARMLRDKGVVEFIDAAKALRERGVRAKFILAGMLDPGNPAALSTYELAQMTRNSDVEWIGHVQDMPELFRRSHIVCLPSYREGLPKVLIEAAAAGRPIVTTDVPGCRDVVTNGVNGLLVAARSVDSLTTALSQLVSDKERRQRMGTEGRRRAEREFSIDLVIDSTLALYADLLAT